MSTQGTFGSLLRDIRLAQGFSRSALGKALGEAIDKPCGRSLVEQWENGKRTPAPGRAMFHAIRRVLGERAGDLLQEAARTERILVTFRCVGRSEAERAALSVFQRLWNARKIDTELALTLQAIEQWGSLARVPSDTTEEEDQ